MGKVIRKPENFTLEQVDALRIALREYKKAHPKLSQTDIGKKLHVGQQTAGGYLSTEKAVGMTYPTATAIAQIAGYSGVDEFFEARGLSSGEREKPSTGWPNLDMAIRHARGLDIEEGVIEAVIKANRDKRGAEAWKAKTWMDKFLDADRFEEERRAADAPPLEKQG